MPVYVMVTPTEYGCSSDFDSTRIDLYSPPIRLHFDHATISIYLSIPIMHITQELSIVVHGAQPRRRAQCKNNATFDDKRQKLFLHQWSNGPLRIERTKARKTFCSCVIIKSGVTSKTSRRYHEVIRRRRHCSQSHAFELSISRVELESKSNRSCNRPFSGVSRRRR